MRLSVKQDKIKKALKIAERVASKSTSLPILNNVLLEAKNSFLHLSATDLETGVSCSLLAKIEKEGKITVPAQVFANFVNYLPSSSTLDMELKSGVLHLSCDKTRAKINGIEAEDFPIIPEVEKGEEICLSSAIFTKGLGQVANIASTSGIKPEISGVYLHFERNLLTMVATDSFRLAEKKFTFSEPFGISKDYAVILPSKAAAFLKSVFSENESDLKIYFSPNLIMIETLVEDEEDSPRFRFVSKLIEGEYPDYKEIIPKKLSCKLIVDRSAFLNHLKRASLFASRINEVKLRFFPERDEVELFCQNPELGEHSSTLSAKLKGKETGVSFNYKFLKDGFIDIEKERIVMGLSEDEKGEDGPAVIKPVDDETYLYVVMPIQPA